MTYRIAVFASGTGSNLKAIHAATQNGSLNQVELSFAVCDRPNAPVIDFLLKQHIPAFVFSAKDYPDKAAFESEISRKLSEKQIDLVVLAGYMRLIGPVLLEKWEGKMINLHPSLLPLFPGKDAIGQAWESGAAETGVTVHFVDAGMDTGPILMQEKITIEKEKGLNVLENQIHQLEHSLLPRAIGKMHEGFKINKKNHE